MTLKELEKRVAALEKKFDTSSPSEMSQAGSANPPRLGDSVEAWLARAGRFEADPVYAEIARRGRAYRDSLRPGAGKKAGKKPKP